MEGSSRGQRNEAAQAELTLKKKKKAGWSLGLKLSWEGKQFMAKGSRLTVNKNTVTPEFPLDGR